MPHFRFIHAADLHLDSPFIGVGQSNPQLQQALRDASVEAWERLIELTIEQEAAFLLLAGDVYDGRHGLRAQMRFLRGVERLSERGISVFVVHGNHDPLDGWSAVRNWPEHVTVFGSDGVESVIVKRGRNRLATIHGISYPKRDVSENLALRFSRSKNPGFQIALLHCTVGSQPDHDRYSPCSLDDLRASGIDYWALGHIHRHAILSARDPCVVYPGTLKGRSPKSSEQGAKGAVVVEVEDGSVTNIEHTYVDSIRFESFEVDVSSIEDLPELRSALYEEAEALREKHSPRGLIVTGNLVGRGIVHDELRRPGVAHDLIQDLREEANSESPLLWWRSIEDQTRVSIDREAIVARGDFSAELLKLSEERSSSLDEFLEPRFKPLKKGRSRKLIPELEPDDTENVFRDAEDLALDLLEREQ